jgi:hypothetical protein
MSAKRRLRPEEGASQFNPGGAAVNRRPVTIGGLNGSQDGGPTEMRRSNQIRSPQKRAELLGSVGALILGMGISPLFARFLTPYTTPLLLTGLLMHAWGMYDKHRLEREETSAPQWWVELLYWVCWVALLVLCVYIAAGYLKTRTA